MQRTRGASSSWRIAAECSAQTTSTSFCPSASTTVFTGRGESGRRSGAMSAGASTGTSLPRSDSYVTLVPVYSQEVTWHQCFCFIQNISVSFRYVQLGPCSVCILIYSSLYPSLKRPSDQTCCSKRMNSAGQHRSTMTSRLRYVC